MHFLAFFFQFYLHDWKNYTTFAPENELKTNRQRCKQCKIAAKVIKKYRISK